MTKRVAIVFFYIVACFFSIRAQTTTRPMIWVTPNEKQTILKNIESNSWLKQYYTSFVKRVQSDIDSFQKNPKLYLSGLPFDMKAQKAGQIPPFIYVYNADKDAAAKRNKYQHYLKTAIDCGIIYYLTDDEKYAKLSTAVFYTFLKSMLQLKPSETTFNGGLIYQDDHLRESREIGAQIPIIYDFIYPYITKGGKAYNFVTNAYNDISIAESETIFKTYIHLALGRGIVNCNWPVLESSSLVSNTLALNSESERNKYLNYYLAKDTTHQDALPKVASVFKKDINWPESLNYSTHVAELSTYLMALLTKINPSLHLGKKYPEVLRALTLPYYLTYPNNVQKILFGDGGRSYHHPIISYELGYFLGSLENGSSMVNEFGSLLNTAIADSSYKRAHLAPRSYVAHPYFEEPLRLLWFCPEINGEVKAYPQPTTLDLPFAGILLQRNLSKTGNAKDGLMAFVGGGAFVHGHASGMNMELYGQGHVLGTKAGKSAYGTEIHENYYRLFAGHNTVVVNGVSRGEGGWVNLAINTVTKVAMEPAAYKKPVSENYSFTTSSFLDDKGDLAEAKQERTLGIIRTSPATGYYIDIYRSESKLPNQYHDYIYHNVGDSIVFNTSDKDFVLKPDEQRFKGNQKNEWKSDQDRILSGETKKWKPNSDFIDPGWHYFTGAQTASSYNNKLEVIFEAEKLSKQLVKMKLFITGDKDRDYTKVFAPPSTETVKAYKELPTPTLVIRKKGAAWHNPFVVVFESFTGDKTNGSIESVENIMQQDVFKGVIVTSKVKGKLLKQIIINQESDDSIFEDANLNIKFIGRYAVLTLNEKSGMKDLYIGSGTSFSYRQWSFATSSSKIAALNVTLEKKTATITSTQQFKYTLPKDFSINETILNN